MTGRTHDLAGFTFLVIIFVTRGAPQMSVATLVASIFANQIGALFPDLDQATSKFWQFLPAGPFIAKLLAPLAGGHRNITHSLLGLILVFFFSQQVFGLLSKVLLVDTNIVWISFMIGVVSHLFMDLITDQGLPLLWPLKPYFGFPPLKVLRPTTNGIAEKLLIFPSLLLLNFYLLYQNYEIFVNYFKQNITR